MSDKPLLTTAKPTWKHELLLICDKCERKARKRGAWEREALHKHLSRELKARDARKQVRIASVECLDLCPKSAVTVMKASSAGTSRPLAVIRDEESPVKLVDWLLAG